VLCATMHRADYGQATLRSSRRTQFESPVRRTGRFHNWLVREGAKPVRIPVCRVLNAGGQARCATLPKGSQLSFNLMRITHPPLAQCLLDSSCQSGS
jgi:hypothetical protein